MAGVQFGMYAGVHGGVFEMKSCRVCSHPVANIFHSEPRSILSITKPIDAPLNVYRCEACGHGQSDDIDYARFYSHDYKFQLESAEHDQLHAVVDGRKIYRSDLQAEIATKMLDLPPNAKVLDYGAAKASTLRKMCATRPDLQPYVYDVSADYVPLWDEWIAKDAQAPHEIPKSWAGTFDAILCFFVFEHVEKPNEIMQDLLLLLKPGGRLFIMVPNPLVNYGDLVVFEHVSHFTPSSLFELLNRNLLASIGYSQDAFFGAHAVVATTMRKPLPVNTAPEIDGKLLGAVAGLLASAQEKVIKVAESDHQRPCAIYGAGVYGNYIATRIESRANVKAFVDRNPQLWGTSEFGIPIVSPDQLPADVDLVYAGVNPLKAREILGDVPEWRGRNIEIVYIN